MIFFFLSFLFWFSWSKVECCVERNYQEVVIELWQRGCKGHT